MYNGNEQVKNANKNYVIVTILKKNIYMFEKEINLFFSFKI